MSQSSVTEKRTVITSSSTSGGYENLDDIPYKANLGNRSNIISRSSLPIHSGGGSQLVRTMEYNYGSSMGGMGPGGFSNVSNTGVTTVKSSREKEKKDLRDLNERFANYIEKVRFLEAQNRKLGSELDELRSKWGKETSHIKQMYEAELAEARRLIDDLSKDKAALEIKSSSILEQNADIQRQLDEAKKYRNQDRETINKLNQQLADYESEINMLRRSIESLETERSRDKGTINRLQQEVDKLRIDLNNETLAHLDAENRRQTLEEEMEFMKKVHEQELKELAALAYRDTTAENREFWKSELAQAIRDIQNEYDAKVDAIRGDMEAFYNLKIQEYRTGATKQNMEVTHIREENKKMVKQMSELRSKLTEMEARNAQLEKQYQDVLRELESKDTDHMMETQQLREEISKLRAEMEGILTELQTLMDAKLSLELEIAAYRKLLEGEENRVDWRSRASMIMYRDAIRPRSTYERSYPEEIKEKPVERKPDPVVSEKPVERKPEPVVFEKPVERKPEPVVFEKPVERKPEPIVFEKPIERKPEPIVFEKPVERNAEPVVSAQPGSPEPHDASPDTDAASNITMSDQDMSPKGEHPDMDIADIDEVEAESSGEGQKLESSDTFLDKGKSDTNENPTDHLVQVKDEVKKIESRAQDTTDGTESSPDHSPSGSKSPIDVAIKCETADISESKPAVKQEDTNKSNLSEELESKITEEKKQPEKASPVTVEQVSPEDIPKSITAEPVVKAESVETESIKPIVDVEIIEAKQTVHTETIPVSDTSRNEANDTVDGENNMIDSTEVETKHATNEVLSESRTQDEDQTSPLIETKTQDSIDQKQRSVDKDASKTTGDSQATIDTQEDGNDKPAPATTANITEAISESSEKSSSAVPDKTIDSLSESAAEKTTDNDAMTDSVVTKTVAGDPMTTSIYQTDSTLDTFDSKESKTPDSPEPQKVESGKANSDKTEVVTDIDNVESELKPIVDTKLSSCPVEDSNKVDIVQDTKTDNDKTPEKTTTKDVSIVVDKTETLVKDTSNVTADNIDSDLQKSVVKEETVTISPKHEIVTKEKDTVVESGMETASESKEIKSEESTKVESPVKGGDNESNSDKREVKELSQSNQKEPEPAQPIQKPNSLLPDTLGKTEDKILETVVKSKIIEKSPQEQSLIVEASPSKELPEPFPETASKDDKTQSQADQNQKDKSPDVEILDKSKSTEAIEDDKTPDVDSKVDRTHSPMKDLQEQKPESDTPVSEQSHLEKTDDTEKDPLTQAMKSPVKQTQDIAQTLASTGDVQHVDQAKNIESVSKDTTNESKAVSKDSSLANETSDTSKQDSVNEKETVASEKQTAALLSEDNSVVVKSIDTKPSQDSETEKKQDIKSEDDQKQIPDNEGVDSSQEVAAVTQEDIIQTKPTDNELINKSKAPVDNEQIEDSLTSTEKDVSKVEKDSVVVTEATHAESKDSQIDTKQEVKLEHSEKQTTVTESTETPKEVAKVDKGDIVASETTFSQQKELQTETKQELSSEYAEKQTTVTESAAAIKESSNVEKETTTLTESKDTKETGEVSKEVIAEHTEKVTPVTESVTPVQKDSAADSSSVAITTKDVEHQDMSDEKNQELEEHHSEKQDTATVMAKSEDTLTIDTSKQGTTVQSALIETKIQESAKHESHEEQKSITVSTSADQQISKTETETSSKASSDVAIAQTSSVKQTTDSEHVSSDMVKQQSTTESVSKVEAKSDITVKETTSTETSKSIEASQSTDVAKSEITQDEITTISTPVESQASSVKETVTVSKESHQTESSSEAHLSKTSSESSTVVNGTAHIDSATTDVKAVASVSQTQETKAIQQTEAVSEKTSQSITEQPEHTTDVVPASQTQVEPAPAVNGEVEKAVEPATKAVEKVEEPTTKADDALTEKIEKLLLNGDVGLKRVVEQVVNTQSSGGEMLSEIVSGYENRGVEETPEPPIKDKKDSQVSMKMMRGEVSAKTTYQRTSTGPIAISEVAADGKYIVLENTSSGPKRQDGKKSPTDVNLDSWKLRRTVDGTRDYTYNFRNFTLKAGKSVKILARSAASEAGLNDLVFRDEDSWGFGSQVKTSLINDKSEEKASHVQKTLYN